MAEEMIEEENKDTKKKTDSRKFIVWITWLILSLIICVGGVLFMVITKKESGSFIDLIKVILGWFFAISMMYLGMNVTQKVGFAITDLLKTEKIN